jgi:hypothetical protein
MLKRTSTSNKGSSLFPPFDVLAGISYCPPLTDPFFIEKQLGKTYRIKTKRGKDLAAYSHSYLDRGPDLAKRVSS